MKRIFVTPICGLAGLLIIGVTVHTKWRESGVVNGEAPTVRNESVSGVTYGAAQMAVAVSTKQPPVAYQTFAAAAASVSKLSLEEQLEFWKGTGDHFAKVAPEAAAATIFELPDSPGRTEILRRFFGTWVKQNPVSAIHTMEQFFTKGTTALDVYRTVAATWSSMDSFRASRWISTLGPGTKRDAAVMGLVDDLSRDESIMAAQWAASISDESLRRETLQKLAPATPGA